MFEGVYNHLLDTFGYEPVEWFNTDVSDVTYDTVYEENYGGTCKIVKSGEMRGLMINSPAQLIAAFNDSNDTPFTNLEQSAIFKCSATDCKAIGILDENDNLDYLAIGVRYGTGTNSETGESYRYVKSGGEIKGVLNHKFIRYRGQWYRVCFVNKGNIVKGKPSNVVFAGEIVADLRTALNLSNGTALEIVDNTIIPTKYTVYLNNEVYGIYNEGVNVNISPPQILGKVCTLSSNDVILRNNSFIMPSNDVYITATYTDTPTVTYTVSYSYDKESEEYQEGDTVYVSAPNIEGKTFNYWYATYTDNLNEKQSIEFDNITSSETNSFKMPAYDVYVNPHYSTKQCTVLFKMDNYNFSTTTVAYAGYVSKPSVDPRKTGYTFDYWEDSAGNEITFPAQIYDDTIFYAHFTSNLTVTFFADGAEYDTVSVVYGGTVNKPATDPTKTYYTFNEWQDAQGNAVNFPAQVYEDKVYYADFTRDTYTVTYIVDGVTYSTAQILGGNSISSFPTAPTKEGYTFSSWQLNGVNVTTSYIPTSNITLAAYFTEIVSNPEITDIDLTSTFNVTYAEINFIVTFSAASVENKANMGVLAEGSTRKAQETERNWYRLPMYKNKDVFKKVTRSPNPAQRGILAGGFKYNVTAEEDLCLSTDITLTHSVVFINGYNNSTRIARDGKLFDAMAVTYSKWHYDPYDDDLQKAPHPPIFTPTYLDDGRVTVNCSICCLCNNDGDFKDLMTWCRNVVDLGNGWYRYEWGQDSSNGIYITNLNVFKYDSGYGDSRRILTVDPPT